MAKSRFAKVQKRLRASRRELLKDEVINPNLEILNKSLKLSSKGFQYQEIQKKNAFLHPNEESAAFPQFIPRKIVDFRSSHNPYSGYEMPGNLRKKQKTVVVEESPATLALKTAEDQNVETEILNNLINLKLEPDRISRKIEKKVNEQRYRSKKGKAAKRQLRF